MHRTAAILVTAALLGTVSRETAAQRAAKQLYIARGPDLQGYRPAIQVDSPSAAAPAGALRVRHALAKPWQPAQLSAARTLRVRLSWSATDIALAGAFTAALLIDHGQTRKLARDGWNGWRETNPILGPRPSVGQLDTYATFAGLAVLGTAAALPGRFRSWFLGAAFAVEAFTIAGTVQRGIAIRLP